MLTKFIRTGLMMIVLSALFVLSACTWTVQPEGDMGQGELPAREMTGQTVAEFVLYDGTSCRFSGTGATVAFDDKRVTYTCIPVDASESATQTLALLNEPVIAGPTEYLVDFATVAQTEGGFELHASRAITFTAWQIVLDDGRECFHAGFGATMGFEGKRLNYTCDKGDSTADEVGLMGELSNAGEGVWLAQIDEIGRDANGFVQLSSNLVPVARVSGMEIRFDEESESTPVIVDVNDALIGTTWYWVGTQYGDDSVVTAADPSRYTLTFDNAGGVAVQLDCNQGSADYTVDGSTLILGPIVSTLMACPEGSQATDFAKDLAEVYSYVMEDGHLYLSMKLDSGIMEFAPMEAMDEAESTPEASEEAANSDLLGTTWYWVETQYGNDTVLTAADPSRYTLTFDNAGGVAVKLDCNQGSADYTVDGASLSFGPIASTLMGCPEGSQATDFAKDLAEVTSYVMEDGHLYLSLKLDVGIMEFAPMEAMDEAESTPEASEDVADSDLLGTTWQWEQSIYDGDVTLVVDDPSRYLITLHDDGTVAVQLDCNRGRSSYVLNGSALSFGPITSTRMGCPADSQDTAFGTDLAAVTAYALADGNLHLTLGAEEGVMEFSPVE